MTPMRLASIGGAFGALATGALVSFGGMRFDLPSFLYPRTPAPSTSAPAPQNPEASAIPGRPLPDLRQFLHLARLADDPILELRRSGPRTALAAIDASLTQSAHVSTPAVETSIAPGLAALSYAAGVESLANDGNPLLDPPPPILVDITGVREAIAAYRSGDIAAGDLAASRTTNPLARTAVEWAAIRLQPRFERISAFLAARSDWPASQTMRRRVEEALYVDKRSPKYTLETFSNRKPETPLGKIALARANLADGKVNEANELIRQVWRESDLTASLEASLRKEFPDALTKADHKFRSDRFFYKENSGASLRAAGYAGADIVALANARASLNEKAIAALPPELKQDPTLLFARIQKLRRENKGAEAAVLMLTAPRNPIAIVSGDDWWVERRLVSRKVLDLGDAKTAWKIAAEHSAVSRDQKIEAEFHAGWYALRFLEDAELAKNHFANCARLAETPISISRAAYWQGRAAEATGDKEAAHSFYETAANQLTTYYGQLARARLGRDDLAVRKPARVAAGDDRIEAVRVVELLEALDQKDLAAPLAIEMARALDDEAQLAALAEVLARAKDAATTLSVGKLASQRGFPLDESAFPTFGIPRFEPLARSAEKPLVYAIARQESAFTTQALSGAGAKGLMQMLTSTARVTAKRAGVPFTEDRLVRDPAFNAQLGAAHLADLLDEYRNSHILTFAAYNAGGKRVKEWIAAYGDPRDPNVDAVDWVEHIPIAETRNYVQRIAENLEIYRVRINGRRKLGIEQTLHSADARR